MKTTIDISDILFQKTKEIAKEKRTSFREIVETALRQFLESQAKKTKSFVLKTHTFNGQGLQEGFTEGDWNTIRKRIYDGRGG